MSQSMRKEKLLSRYLKDFKHKQTHCSHCGKTLDRVSLLFRHQLINKKSISSIDRLIDGDTWATMQQELIPLCRFCSEILSNTHTRYFDIQAFTRYLIDKTDVKHSTMREYVIRLRRLDALLAERNCSRETFADGSVQQRICDDFPDLAQNIYRSALRQYDQYLTWRERGRLDWHAFR